jgi:AcrR family transcriptional regulator
MRGRLAKAAYEVIAERGHSAFRTAAVAERAGVSQGALTHHFSNKEALTLAAIEYAFATASSRTANIAEHGLEPGQDVLRLMVEDFRLFFMGNEFWVALDITLDGSKDAELARDIRPIVARYRRPVYDRWIAILIASGWSEENAVTMVRMTAALLSGFGMRTLWEDVGAYLDGILAEWQDIMRTRFPLASRQPVP